MRCIVHSTCMSTSGRLSDVCWLVDSIGFKFDSFYGKGNYISVSLFQFCVRILSVKVLRSVV